MMSAAKMVADSTQAELTDAGDGRKRKKKLKKGGKKVVLPEDEDSDLDLKRELRPIGDFIKDRPAMIREMFRAVRGASLARALPDLLKSIPLEELTLLCQEQLEVMSKKRIRRILAGEESANISSSGTEDDTSDEEVAIEGDGGAVGTADQVDQEKTIPDRHPADSTSVHQDSPRFAVSDGSVEQNHQQHQQSLQQQVAQFSQQQHQQRQPTQQQQPAHVAAIPLPVPLAHVKQEPPDSDDDAQRGRGKDARPASPQQRSHTQKNYRRKHGSGSKSSSRSSSRSSRSSRSSSYSSRSSSSSRSSASGGDRRRRRTGGKSGRRQRDSRRRRTRRGNRRGSSADSYHGYGGNDGPQTGRFPPGPGAAGDRRGVLPAQPPGQAPVAPPMEEEDENPELYTSGSEDGELVRREELPNIPAGVKVKKEPGSDSEQQQPQDSQEPSTEPPQQQQQQQQQQALVQEQQAVSGDPGTVQTPDLVDTQPQELPPPQHLDMEKEKTPETGLQDSLQQQQQQQPESQPGVSTEQEKEAEETVGDSQTEPTDKQTDSQSSVTPSGSLAVAEAGEEEENHDDDDEEDDEDDEEEDEDMEEEEGDGEGDGEMDQMELLELEMRARAIKAMLGSHSQPGDATDGKTGKE